MSGAKGREGVWGKGEGALSLHVAAGVEVVDVGVRWRGGGVDGQRWHGVGRGGGGKRRMRNRAN